MARRLKTRIDSIRTQYREDLKSKEMRIRQRWVGCGLGGWGVAASPPMFILPRGCVVVEGVVCVTVHL